VVLETPGLDDARPQLARCAELRKKGLARRARRRRRATA